MVGTTISRHTDRVQAAVASNEAARSPLVASWQRSLALHHLDPSASAPPQRLTSAELRQARQRIEPLLHAAQGSLDRLYQAVGGVGCCVLLADRDGIPLERRGAASDDDTFDEWGLWTGTVWSERCEGTNGIGTCLVEQRALTIHRDQHFFSRNALMSCTTAPIFDHEGRLAAALDVSSCRADLTEGFASLIAMAVVDAARRIEAETFRMAFPHARIVVAPNTDKTGDKGAGGLLALDPDDMVIGATRGARQSLGLSDEVLGGTLPASALLGGPRHEDLTVAERGALQRALARAGGNVSAAAKLLGISRATMHRKLNKAGVDRPH